MLIVSIGLVLAATGILTVISARHAADTRQRLADEVAADARTATGLIWSKVDQWMSDQTERTDNGGTIGPTGIGFDPTGKYMVADTQDQNTVISEQWRVARIGGTRLTPGASPPDSCTDTDLKGTTSVCWRIHILGQVFDTSPPETIVGIQVGVWCTSKPNPEAELGDQGCEAFRTEFRRYLKFGFTQWGQHFHTAALPTIEEVPGAPEALKDSLSPSSDRRTHQEFWPGYRFEADVHTNDEKIIVCGKVQLTQFGEEYAKVSVNNPAPPLDPFALPVEYDSQPFDDYKRGVWRHDSCGAAQTGIFDSEPHPGPYLHKVHNGGALYVEAGLDGEPWCSNRDPFTDAGQIDLRTIRATQSMPPGTTWLAGALAAASSADPPTVVDPDTWDTSDPGMGGRGKLFYTKQEAKELITGYSSLSVDPFHEKHPLNQYFDRQTTAPIIDLEHLKDGDVVWSSYDPVFVTGRLKSTPESEPRVTIAATGTIVLIPKNADPESLHPYYVTQTSRAQRNWRVVGSNEDPRIPYRDESALALVAGCHIDIAPIPVLDAAGKQFSDGGKVDDQKTLLNRVAALAPAGFVFSSDHSKCQTGNVVPCPVPNVPDPSDCADLPTIWVRGSIASRHKAVFGQHAHDGLLVGGYCERVTLPLEWEQIEFPWWPKIQGGAWQPA